MALMGARSQFWHYAAVFSMNVLGGGNIGNDFTVSEYGRRRIIATAFYAQYSGVNG
jgi:hypothetical protein